MNDASITNRLDIQEQEFPPSGNAKNQTDILATLRLLRPAKAKDFDKIRMGTAHDGGYVLLDDFSGVDTVLSFGIENNVDFDLAVADRVGRVLQFDHTIDKSPVSDPRLTWAKKRDWPGAERHRRKHRFDP